MLSWLKKSSSSLATPQVVVAPTSERLVSQAALQNDSTIHKSLGDNCFEEGKLEESIHHYQHAIRLNPQFAEAHVNLSNVLQMQLRFAEAEQHLRLSIKYNPQLTFAYYNLGSLLLEQGKHQDAIFYLQKSIELNPDIAAAFIKIGQIQLGGNHLNDALSSYLKAIELEPDHAPTYVNIGNIYNDLGSQQMALNSYKRALEIDPTLAISHLNIGILLSKQGQLNDAISHYQAALAIQPDCEDAHYNLGLAYADQGNRTYARDSLKKALQLSPEHLAALGGLAHQMQHMCEWEGLPLIVEQIRKLTIAAPEFSSSKNWIAPFSYISLPGINAQEQKDCIAKCINRIYPSSSPRYNSSRFPLKSTETKKISVAYLSANFQEHPVSYLMAEVIELHDRSRFHVTAYNYNGNEQNLMRERLNLAFDEFVDISDLSVSDAAKRIYADNIDILVDLTGHTQHSKSEIMTLHPAPVQVNYLGYPGTMGADFVDYIIADRFVIPEASHHYYTEKVAYLPDCFQANDRQRPRPSAPSRTECGLPETAFVFCCFNQTLKITSEVFDIWCRLLLAVPDSILWIASSNPQAEYNLLKELAIRGINGARLVVAPILPRKAYLARLQCADVFLDTLPFNAGTTCSDALWMGLPVITCAGDTFAARMAGSLLTTIDVPELITYNLEDYYHLALELATDRIKLAAIRNKIIANRETSPLFDSESFTRNMESAYIKMIADYTKKNPTLN